jgi:preprotein translocase subunit SecB
MTNQVTAPTAPATPAVDNQPYFGIQRIYMKGQSLEIPAGARLFLETTAPDLNLALQVSMVELSGDVFEVSLRGTLTASVAGKTAYLVEVDQAGIFEVRAPAGQRADMLEIGAPSILAPYLRAQLSDVLTRATLPVFLLPEINWPAMAN